MINGAILSKVALRAWPNSPAQAAHAPCDGVAEHDPAFAAETRIETLKMVCDIEKHSVPANVSAWLVIAIAATMLPNAGAFAIPLLLRLWAMVLNRRGWHDLRQQLVEKPDRVPSFTYLRLCLFAAGVTWALLLFPLLAQTMVHPARVAVGGTVIMGISVIYSMLAHMRSCAASLGIGFLAGFAMAMPWHDPVFSVIALTGAVAMGGCLMAFSKSAARQKITTARTLVLNRRLEVELGQSLEQAQYLATRDPLTGLLNRRAFFTGTADFATDDTERFLMTMDLDHFKQVNDVHGHEVGDQVLVATARQIHALLAEMPGSDHRACRFGGEEFVMLICGADQLSVYRHAELLRQNLRRIPDIIGMAGDLKVSASIGVAHIAQDEDIDDALRRSDLAMYRAKDRGRDNVVIANELEKIG
ncbi:MAG: GGDEF domain-containing protein [Pontixanthobacter sp.]